jgi:hypothetical protein
MVVGNTTGGVFGAPEVWSIERSGVTPTDMIDSLVQLEPAMRRAREQEAEILARPLAPIDTLAAIRFAKQIKVPPFTNQPAMTLEEWISHLAGSQARVTWKLVGCGATVTSYQLRDCDDYRAAVEVSVDNPLESFGVEVCHGTFRRGIFGEPKLQGIYLWNKRINRANYSTPDLPSLEAQLDSIRNR